MLTNPEIGVAASELIDENLREALVTSLVSSLSTVHLRDRHVLSSAARFEPLRAIMTHDREVSRHMRESEHVLFSATHFEALLYKATEHLAQEPSRHFDAIKAAREAIKLLQMPLATFRVSLC